MWAFDIVCWAWGHQKSTQFVVCERLRPHLNTICKGWVPLLPTLLYFKSTSIASRPLINLLVPTILGLKLSRVLNSSAAWFLVLPSGCYASRAATCKTLKNLWNRTTFHRHVDSHSHWFAMLKNSSVARHFWTLKTLAGVKHYCTQIITCSLKVGFENISTSAGNFKLPRLV